MPWAIRQTGNAGYLQLASQLVFSSTDDWKFEFATLAPAGTTLFKVHGLRAAAPAQIYIDVPTLKLTLLFSPGTDRIDCNLPSGFDISVRHDFILEKSGGVFNLLMDGVPLSYVKQGTGTSWGSTSGIAAFFRSGNVTMADGQLFYFKFTKNSVLQNNFINESGTGTSWIDTVGGNNAAQAGTWPSGDSEWVFYSTGESLTFSGTLPKLTAAISANVASGIGASFSGSMPKLQASINANISAVTDSLSFSGTLPKLTASISATVSGAPNSLYFSGALPKLRASIDAAVSLPPPLVAFSGILPRLRMQAAMIIPMPQPAGDPLALKQALVNARRAEENRNNEYVPPVVIVPDWYIIQQRALGLKQSEANRARDEE